MQASILMKIVLHYALGIKKNKHKKGIFYLIM